MSVLEYLNGVLLQRGPNAPPYPENTKWTIRDHCVELHTLFPTLGLSVTPFVSSPDGRGTHLLKSEGTIPVHYQGIKYNIPILVWIPEHYPIQSPLAFVVPTESMVIKARHPYVDMNGQVSTPLIRSWNPGNNLVELVLQMSEVFGSDPPLYSSSTGQRQNAAAAATMAAGAAPSAVGTRPPSFQQPPTLPPSVRPPPGYPRYPAQTLPPSFQGFSGASAGGAAAGWLANPTPSSGSMNDFVHPPLNSGGSASDPGYGRPPQPSAFSVATVGAMATISNPPPPPPPPPIPRAEMEAPFRSLALTALRLQLQAVENAYQETAQLEMDALLEMQRKLEDRKSQLQNAVNVLKAERQGTEGAVREMGQKSAQLQKWLEVNEPKAAALAAGADLTQAVAPADDLAKQVLEAHAEDLALEDAMRVLDRALQTGSAGLTPAAYLKQVRVMCRRQFLARALGMKVTETRRQQQQQPVQPAGGASSMLNGAAAAAPGRAVHPPPPPPPAAWQSTPYREGAGMMGGAPPPPPPPMMWS
ncbi:hypothetical protein CEUSTIGMA_g1910.t1 [Chlamydomonas eustigma]|uniref:UEV domain-containing protein n=1 Tax=Chlamydomonas eustigma TaxID=1157962 RepID=A0A250WUH6_9CHLO|nr:hypothetical protein CEUSTIGMA_g1910.t1 [Chlamydomonas eustigma]|eukprot:GAX74461.1 hypothetical protein CEUSTIGMA_g1910.t1 [Chlamydomonas eustigma]